MHVFCEKQQFTVMLYHSILLSHNKNENSFISGAYVFGLALMRSFLMFVQDKFNVIFCSFCIPGASSARAFCLVVSCKTFALLLCRSQCTHQPNA